ncbi:MAG: aminopeptidase P N-terminal domain-containing protein, partial [Vicinamibacteria bacterium]
MTLRRTATLSLALSACAVMVSAAPAVREETAAFFKAHREKLLQRLPADSIAVFHTPAEKDIEATTDPFRPDSDFWYLTGFQETDAVAVFRPNAPDGKRFVLFVAPKDFAKEQWTGYRAGTEGAVKEYGADEAFLVTDLWTKLPSLLLGAKSLEFSDARDARFREQLLAAWNQENKNAIGPRPAADAGPAIHQLRLLKDETEISILRRAALLSAEAHRAAMARVRPGVNEAVLKGLMVSHCVANGSARMAYPPIVGSGRNSVILHYLADDQPMEAASMVVNDTA